MSELVWQGYNKQSLVVIGDRQKYGQLIKNIGGRWNSRLKNFQPGWTVPRDKEAELKKLINEINNPAPVEKSEEPVLTETKSRKNQKKYHRAVSASESDDSDDNRLEQIVKKKQEKEPEKEESDNEPEVPVVSKSVSESPKKLSPSPAPSIEEQNIEHQKQKAKSQFREEKRLYEQKMSNSHKRDFAHSPPPKQPISQHETFSKKPSKFRALYQPSDSDNEHYSSSDSSDSSDSSSDDFPIPESPKRQSRRHDQEDYGQLFNKVRTLQKKLYEMELKNKDKKGQEKELKKIEHVHKHKEHNHVHKHVHKEHNHTHKHKEHRRKQSK